MNRLNRLRAASGVFKGTAWREKAPLPFRVLKMPPHPSTQNIPRGKRPVV